MFSFGFDRCIKVNSLKVNRLISDTLLDAKPRFNLLFTGSGTEIQLRIRGTGEYTSHNANLAFHTGLVPHFPPLHFDPAFSSPAFSVAPFTNLYLFSGEVMSDPQRCSVRAAFQ